MKNPRKRGFFIMGLSPKLTVGGALWITLFQPTGNAVVF